MNQLENVTDEKELKEIEAQKEITQRRLEEEKRNRQELEYNVK